MTGSTPIEKDTVQKEAFFKVPQSIREKDPPRPSARLSSSTNAAVTDISAQRKIDSNKLPGLLRGELDWIVMKAIEIDRTRRYDTANSFAIDIQNYLSGEVVTARPPSTSYRIRKYVRRNKGLVTSLASITTLLIAGIIGVGWFAIAAELARRNAIIQKSTADIKTVEAATEAANARLAEKAIVDLNTGIAEFFLYPVPFHSPFEIQPINLILGNNELGDTFFICDSASGQELLRIPCNAFSVSSQHDRIALATGKYISVAKSSPSVGLRVYGPINQAHTVFFDSHDRIAVQPDSKSFLRLDNNRGEFKSL